MKTRWEEEEAARPNNESKQKRVRVGVADGLGFLPSKNTRIPSSQHKPNGEENLEQRSHGEAGGEEDEGREQEAVGFAPAHHPHIQREHPPSTTPPFTSLNRAGQIR